MRDSFAKSVPVETYDDVEWVDAAYVRAWARERGYPVGFRGHIHKDIVDAFNRRHTKKQYRNTNPAFAFKDRRSMEYYQEEAAGV